MERFTCGLGVIRGESDKRGGYNEPAHTSFGGIEFLCFQRGIVVIDVAMDWIQMSMQPYSSRKL